MIIKAVIDREGNTGLRDLKYVCPDCGSEYDTYEEAKECLLECAIEEHGEILEHIKDINYED